MPTDDASGLPNVREILASVLARVSREEQPLLVAIAERMAAERYRGWAKQAEADEQRGQLLACARREEEIAGTIEGLLPDAAPRQREILARNPDVADVTRALFGERPLREQLAIQAQGERLGAATWRAFARDGRDAFRDAYEACARLEEENAAVLEKIVGI